MKENQIISETEGKDPAEKTCEAFYDQLKRFSEENHTVVVSLCGGDSPKEFYKEIPRQADKIPPEDWKRIHFFWTDERLVPPEDERSNFKMADRLFLHEMVSRGILPEENIHRFRGEAKEADRVLARYNEELIELGGKIHIPILGVGDDGHIGSLFPRHRLVTEQKEEFLLIEDSPKPPARRMTISPAHLKKSDVPFLLFIGKGKREAFRCFESEDDPADCPARLAKQGEGTVYAVTHLRQ